MRAGAASAVLIRLVAVTGLAVLLLGPAVVHPPGARAVEPAARPAGLTIQLLDAPVAGRTDPRARIYIIDQLRAGQTITRHAKVTNNTAGPIVTNLYAGAASIAGDEFRFGTGAAADELTTWTSVVPSAADLGVGQSVELTVTIRVPVAVASGERYAVIWAQVAAPVSVGSDVRVVNRVGIRIYLSVAGSARSVSSFEIGTISASRPGTGPAVVTAAVRNTGQRALDVSGTLGLADGPSHLSAGPFTTDQTATLAPGQSGQVRFTLGQDVPAGRWAASVALASGTTRATAHAIVVLPALGGATIPRSPSSSSSSWLPVLLGLLIGLVLLLMVLFLAWHRRDRAVQPGAVTH